MAKKKQQHHRYDFWMDGVRYVSSYYPTKEEKNAAEEAKRKELRAIRDGRELDQSESPYLQDFSEIYFAWAVKKGKVKGPASFWSIEMALRFFGKRPTEPKKVNPCDVRGFGTATPYHNLRMSDVLRDGSWITRFENWMDQRGIAGATKNKYRSAMSQVFHHAMGPEWRNKTGVTRNPFLGVWRDKGEKRYTTFASPEALVKVIAASPAHLKMAVAVALYCPKFRHGSICRIDKVKQPDSTAWIDDTMEFIYDKQHKTFHKTKEPLAAPIPAPLRRLIQSATKQQEIRHRRLLSRYKRDGNVLRLQQLGKAPCVRLIQWESKPVASLKKGFKSACQRADVPYGMKNGVTFHSLKHEGGTEGAILPGISDPELQDLLGHSTNAANQIYRHRKPVHQIASSNALAAKVKEKLKVGAKGAKLFAKVG